VDKEKWKGQNYSFIQINGSGIAKEGSRSIKIRRRSKKERRGLEVHPKSKIGERLIKITTTSIAKVKIAS